MVGVFLFHNSQTWGANLALLWRLTKQLHQILASPVGFHYDYRCCLVFDEKEDLPSSILLTSLRSLLHRYYFADCANLERLRSLIIEN